MSIPAGGPEFATQILEPCPAKVALAANRMDPGNADPITDTVLLCLFTVVYHPSHDLVP
jgi:hypothetical protein